ncbi:MAG: hypothetical protein LBC61_03445 [Candidatus Peribacteria bacterium]|jgi:hypothetical protein|nr:hypothetical protein [Candidatus Peribacteria bacterium]
MKNTKGTAVQATRASFVPIIIDKVTKTNKIVKIQSLIKWFKSLFISFPKSIISVTYKLSGKAHLALISSIIVFQSETRFTIDPHLFFVTDKVTALRDSFHSIDNLEIETTFFGTSFTSAISFKRIIPVSHNFFTIIFLRDSKS